MGVHPVAAADGGRVRLRAARVVGAPRAGGRRAARQELLRRAQAGRTQARFADTGLFFLILLRNI